MGHVREMVPLALGALPFRHRTNQYVEIGWCRRRRKILVPRFPGLGEAVTHVFILKMLSFFLAFSPGPKEGRICATTSDFVATSIFPRHGDKWGQMSIVAH